MALTRPPCASHPWGICPFLNLNQSGPFVLSRSEVGADETSSTRAAEEGRKGEWLALSDGEGREAFSVIQQKPGQTSLVAGGRAAAGGGPVMNVGET